MIQKTKVRQYINSKGLSVSGDAYDSIIRLLTEVLDGVCLNTAEDGMKTVMPQHCIQKTKTVVTKESNHNLKPQFIQWAKTTQDWCAEQAVIMSRQVKG
jgi:hypothetical protein